jgi:hypothetical protein
MPAPESRAAATSFGRVSNEDDVGRGADPVAGAVQLAGHPDQVGPVDVVVAERRHADIEVVEEPERAELHQAERPDVAGEHRLHHVRLRRQRGDGRLRARQRLAAAGEDVVPVGLGQRTDGLAQRPHVTAVAAVDGERLQQDRPVGTSRQRHRDGQRCPADLGEGPLGHAPAEPGRVHQRAVDVPEHQSRHRHMVASGGRSTSSSSYSISRNPSPVVAAWV